MSNFLNKYTKFNKSNPLNPMSGWEALLRRRNSKNVSLFASGLIIAATVSLTACGATVSPQNSGLPNRQLTPGAINPNVDQANIHSTICIIGWTSTVRPPVDYTNQLKYTQLHSGYNLNGDLNMKHYEEDHIVPLGVGGNPTSPLNLFPEPRNIKLGAYLKDELENRMHQLVCSGQISLVNAQHIFLTNWEKGYSKYVGRLP